MDLTESTIMDPSTTALTSNTNHLVRPKHLNQHFVHSSTHASSAGTSNIDVLQLINITESKNFTCQAQNSFGLVVFNLTIVIKGKLLKFFMFSFRLFLRSILNPQYPYLMFVHLDFGIFILVRLNLIFFLVLFWVCDVLLEPLNELLLTRCFINTWLLNERIHGSLKINKIPRRKIQSQPYALES